MPKMMNIHYKINYIIEIYSIHIILNIIIFEFMNFIIVNNT